MAEVLSQQEIDQLLNKVKSGDDTIIAGHGSEIEVIPFDFRLPNRISKNQLRTIRNIHEILLKALLLFLLPSFKLLLI